MENRKLLDYLPEFIKEYAEMRQLMEAQQPDVDAFNDGVARVWANQFLSDADEYGVSRWEKILNITPKSTDTLDERKFRILAWWTSERPYTMTKLREKLAALCGEDGYEIFDEFAKYLMTFEIKLENRENINSIVDMLDRMLPANIVRNIWLVSDSNIDSGWGVAAVDVLDQEEHLTNDINIDNPDQAYPYTASMAVYDFAEGIEEMTIIGMGTQTDTETAAEYGKGAAMVYDSEQTIGG